MNETSPENKKFWKPAALIAGGIGITALALVIGLRSPAENVREPERHETYAIHQDITATVFWVGESATSDNKQIHNNSSTWVEDWVGAYGGVDDPEKRCDHLPCDFTPKENPFYFALPYNDLDDNLDRKPSAKDIPWYNSASKSEGVSIVKNRWVKIVFNGRAAYAQWEDAGPFGEDDVEYVFGDKRPNAPEAGIDLSPATASWLKINGRDQVDWRFIEETDVPDGPWRKTITRN